MNLRLSTTLIAFFFTLVSHAQLSSIATVENATCSNSNDGVINFNGVDACFAPVTVVLDSTITMNFQTLKNDGYLHLNQGAGPSFNEARSVWAGNTSAGNVYISTGYFTDSIVFDTITVYGNGLSNMFIVCYDAATSGVMWANSATAGASTYVDGYALAGVGDKLYATGYMQGTTDFGSQSLVSSGGYQMYIAKYDIPTGTLDTVIQAGGAGEDYPYNMKYAAGRLYIAGLFNGTTTYAGNNYTSAGNYDVLVTCFDTSLTVNYWAAKAGGTGQDLANDLVVRENSGVVDMVYVVGEFRSTAAFGSNNLTSAGNRDFFIAAIDTNAIWQWAVKGGSTGGLDRAITIDINSTNDRLYVGGVWGGNMTFSSQNFTSVGTADGFIAYMDTLGVLEDLFPLSTTLFDQVVDLKSIDDDYLVFTAQIGASLNYADSTYTISGSTDAFIGKIGPGFHEIWGKNFGGPGNDGFNSLAVGSETRLHVAGYFIGDASAYQSGLVSVSQSDVVVSNDVFSGIADTSVVLSGLAPGEYYAVMTDSNGNTVIDTFTVTAPPAIVASGAITFASNSSATDGAVDVSVSGGTPGYTFNWSNGAITEDITNVAADTYLLTITDSVGCVLIDTFIVDSGLSALNVVSSVTNVQCGGDSSGSINLTVTGGVAPIVYAWSNGASTQDISGLVAGLYTVTVMDNDTAIFIDSFSIVEPPILVVSGIITPPSSGAASDGAVNLTVSGGTPPYSFTWSNSATTEDISGLVIGLYTATVTDSNGCVSVNPFFVDTIPALGAVLAITDVTCLNSDNGTADLSVIGGLPPYTFLWSNGATTEDLSNLASGTYIVTVTDSLLQTYVDTAEVGSNPQFPDPIVGPIAGPNSAQAWTTFNYSVPSSNGSAFLWSAVGGNVNSSASNAAAIQWNAGPTGLLVVKETDANGCYASDSLEVTILFVGVSETDENAVLIYPNPATSFINIGLPESIQQADLVIFDLHGRVIFTKKALNPIETIDLSDVARGVYQLELRTGNTSLSHKIVVE